MSRIRAWPFTINFDSQHPTEDDMPEHWPQNNIKYVSYQFEMEGCLHMQGYVYLKEGRTLAQMKSVFDERAHWEVQRGTFDEAISYTKKPCALTCSHDFCTKEREMPTALPGTHVAWGIPPEKGDGVRDSKVSEAVASLVRAGESLESIDEQYSGYVMINLKRIREYSSYHTSLRALKRKKQRLVDQHIVLRPWQQQVLDELEKQDERHILWIWDDGETGKSNFIGGVLRRDKPSLFRIGMVKGGDQHLVYAYKGQEYVHIDIPYTFPIDEAPYSFMEGLKTGELFSTKYESGELYFDPPKVLVTANKPPPAEKQGKNRFIIRNGKDGYEALNPSVMQRLLNGYIPHYDGPTIALSQTHTPHGYTKPHEDEAIDE